MAMWDVWEGECTMVMGEAMAVRKGLKIAVEAGFKEIIVEVDNLVLFTALSKDKAEVSPYGLILQDIKQLSLLCHQISFASVKRSGNQVAHRLAKRSLNVNELLV
ncbi:BEN domain-containing protein 7 [Bienertia sinuspersici]